MQPTGGPLLLEDTQPDEPKVLIEEKLKKVTTEKAPVAGQTTGASGSGGGRSLQDRTNRIAQLLQEGAAERGDASGGFGPSGMSDRQIHDVLSELVAAQQAQQSGGAGRNEPGAGSGAAAAAGVLTAVDEDQEGDEEAPMPDAFDYYTDAEEDE